ncbi:hypothetical protein N7532_011107 [Penicillium argentinense]|uniref:Uncharacterized protein n=1 Tax=Penicillium argentinense TaxID=1131581 RepID=A0A9W9JU52_9EURO|nr:uncharacterized protein N7532_011107 [Penicillium argentinense]KAJ5082064.1 hypothetical protein N7532_011107 [Penicillium argentinense]
MDHSENFVGHVVRYAKPAVVVAMLDQEKKNVVYNVRYRRLYLVGQFRNSLQFRNDLRPARISGVAYNDSLLEIITQLYGRRKEG